MARFYDHQKRLVRSVHFGSPNPVFGTFIDHGDEKRKEAYLKRHAPNEDWSENGVETAGFWSRWMLWSNPTLKESLREVQKQANNKINNISYDA